ncbi:alcohol oxidase [Epithele typhae]|uniref:alcohol oxidase n=1 Tax=Epithele typhae TaxID=378194 RepID=UPI002007C963|nr:alcohol oxidase [Epithele typhae]KAH9926558.1 alcohol oxidase [Epithele typhae]
MTVVPELTPKQVATPFPISPDVPQDAYTYDYIICGGGTAGCVLASRLSEDPAVSVLLIEQGPVADTWTSRVPLLSLNVFENDVKTARWWSQPLTHADNRFLQIIRGDALGGTSRINGMLYTRGSPGDYNQWALLGNEGWSYDDLEPYFVKSETTRTHPRSQYRGTSGPWQNQQFEDAPYKINPLIEHAIQKAGIPKVRDVNDPATPAACSATMDISQNASFHRHSTYLAFLPPALCHTRKERLKVCTNAVVCKIEVETENDGGLRATGVQFETADARQADRRYVARARREVIVCGGALGSPQMLMLSGGLVPRTCPVSCARLSLTNPQSDHSAVPVAWEVPLSETSPPSSQRASSPPPRATPPRRTHASDLDAAVPANRPDIEFMHLANNASDVETPPGTGIYTLLATLIRPSSTGSVRLATANPRERPAVDSASSPTRDYVPLRKAIRFALGVGRDVRARGYSLQDYAVPRGGEGASDAALDAFVRANVRTCFHYAGTCRMGAQAEGGGGKDPRPSVVDARLRVHGVRGLRVADTSVFPEIIGSHTMAPAVVVAEKCADMVKESWR